MRASLVKVALAATALVTVAVIAGRQGFFAKNATQDQPAIVRSVPSAGPVDTGGPPLAGIDLTRIRVDDNGVSAPAAAGRTAMLTLDPELQKTASALLRSHKFPEAAVVAMDPQTGAILAYASYADGQPPRDLNVVASAPAASLFKIVTGAALVKEAKLAPDTRQCYCGGEQKILPVDLIDDPRRDKWCVTLAGAMGRSVNAVFARLAQKHLPPPALEATAKVMGFGEPVPFDVPVEASTLTLPPDTLGYARTAAGFWNTTLSPLEAAWLSAAMAHGGEAMRPTIVKSVIGPAKNAIYTSPEPAPVRRFVDKDVAAAVTTMMEHTVSEGTSFKAFHDPSGTSFLPNVPVAGKTGTLTDSAQGKLYTWFTGFAPSRPMPGVRPIAIAVLVVNHPQWHVKANTVAREMLRAHLAAEKVPGVTRPVVSAIAHRYDATPTRTRSKR